VEVLSVGTQAFSLSPLCFGRSLKAFCPVFFATRETSLFSIVASLGGMLIFTQRSFSVCSLVDGNKSISENRANNEFLGSRNFVLRFCENIRGKLNFVRKCVWHYFPGWV